GVAGWRVVRLAGLNDVLAVGVGERESSLEHDPPMRARAAVVRQAARQRRHVAACRELLERHGVLAELLEAPLVARTARAARGRCLGCLWHVCSLRSSWTQSLDRETILPVRGWRYAFFSDAP